MKAPKLDTTLRLETDAIVIGAGGSGLAAAATLAEKGLKVIMLEKQPKAGGTTPFAEGVVAAESPTQKRMNAVCSKDELFNNHMYYSHWTLNPRLVRSLIDISGDTVRWLEEKGIVFTLRGLHIAEAKDSPVKSSNQAGNLVFHVPQNWGSAIVKVLAKECVESGVQIIYQARATKLLTDKKNTVIGVKAKRKEQEITITSKSVVLATGGYGSSKKLMKKYCPGYNISNIDNLSISGTHPGDRIRWVGNMHSGDGIEMAFDVGADSEGLGILLMDGPNFVAGNHGWMLAMNPGAIRVNSNGERFTAEDLGPFMSDNATLRQPGQVCYTLFDEAFKQNIIKKGFGPISGGKYYHDASRIDEDLDAAVQLNSCKVSNSWDDIAAWIKADPETLKASIVQYNHCCSIGHDDLFAKKAQLLIPLSTPPYYACRCYPGFLVTIGGIKINHRMEVLDKNQHPIKGLYAVGITAGGWSAATYNIGLPGAGCGFPIYGGRIAGGSVAKYISEKYAV